MAGSQSYYNVTITNSNTNSSPSDGFIDNITVQNYGATSLETTPAGWTLATCTAKRRGNVRYQEMIEQIGFVTLPSILIGSISSNATAVAEATSFAFTVMIQHGDASLITADELNAGQYLTSTTCLQRCIARALIATVYKEMDIFDPTESTTVGSYSTQDIIRMGPRIYTAANFEVGPYGTSLAQVTPYITITQSNYWLP